MALYSSILDDPTTGALDPARLAQYQAIMYAALAEADRIAQVALTRLKSSSDQNFAAVGTQDIVSNTLPRLARYRAGADAASSDPGNGLWSTAIDASTNGRLPFDNFLAAIQQETTFSNQDINALVADAQTAGFWNALAARASGITQAIYDEAAKAGTALKTNLDYGISLIQNLVPIALGAAFVLFVLPSLLKTAAAGRRGGANAALDTAAGELESGRRAATSAARTGAKVALLGAPKNRTVATRRQRRRAEKWS